MTSMLSVDLASAIVRARHEDAGHSMRNARLLAARREQRRAWTGYRIRLSRLAVS